MSTGLKVSLKLKITQIISSSVVIVYQNVKNTQLNMICFKLFTNDGCKAFLNKSWNHIIRVNITNQYIYLYYYGMLYRCLEYVCFFEKNISNVSVFTFEQTIDYNNILGNLLTVIYALVLEIYFVKFKFHIILPINHLKRNTNKIMYIHVGLVHYN